MSKWILLLVMSGLMLQQVNAMQQTNFDRASAEYKDANKGTINKDLSGKVNASDYSKSDINSSDAERYYEDEKAMDKAKQQQFAENTSAQRVHKTSITNTHEIDPNNPTYKKAVSCQTNAEQILSNEGERYDCQHIQKDGGKKTHTETCQVSNITPMQCSKYPVIKITDVPYQAPIKFSGSLIKYGQYSYGLALPESGTINGISIKFWHEGHNSFFCHTTYNAYINGQHFGSYRNNGCSHLCYYLPFAKQGLNVAAKAGTPVRITFAGGGLDEHLNRYPYTVNATVTRSRKEAQVTWTDNCQHINKDACVKMSETCVEGKATRNFGGVNVTQDCWKYDYTYKCGYKKHDNCDEIAKRCDFVSQKCIEEAHGYCYAYERTYQCSEAQEGSKTLICGNPNTIQFTHNIDKADPADFMKAVSALAGASEMAEDISKAQKDIAMLKGNPADCGEGAMGVYDCCDGDGNFLHGCSDSEKGLQKARQRKIATFVGRYCGKKVLGVCVAHRQSWCVFESKLARILQEQGRRKQLGISFGSGEHPNCAGIPVHDLQRIDFTKIDFSEFFDEVKSKVALPDNKTASGMFNKFKAGKTSPEINSKQKNSRINT